MTSPTSLRDAELISAYLDNELTQAEKARLEASLKNNPELAGFQADLSQSRALLRKLPARRAARNFMLTPQMAGIKPPLPRAFPVFRFVSALAALLFFVVFAANISVPAFYAVRAVAPAPILEQGAGIEPNPSAMQAAQPQMDNALQVTATPELRMLAPAQPQATELSSQQAILPIETQPAGMPMAPAAPVVVEPGAQAKMIPEAPLQTQEAASAQPIRLPVPALLQFGLLGLAVLSGGLAFSLRLRFENNWFRARSIKQAGLGLRQVTIILLLLLLIAGLAASIYYFSIATFYAPVSSAP